MALGDCQVAIAGKDHLALLGQFEHRRSGYRGAGHDRATHRTATAANRAAAAMEYDQLDTGGVSRFGEVLLRAVRAPRRGKVATIFVAVRVANHDLLLVATR